MTRQATFCGPGVGGELAGVPCCALEAAALGTFIPGALLPTLLSTASYTLVVRVWPRSQVLASRVLLATASFPTSSLCDDIRPAGASILTGYALHITELDVGVENAGDKGTPSTFGRFTVIRLEHSIRESPVLLLRLACSSFACLSMIDASMLYR
jgi:hypothetical protein